MVAGGAIFFLVLLGVLIGVLYCVLANDGENTPAEARPSHTRSRGSHTKSYKAHDKARDKEHKAHKERH